MILAVTLVEKFTEGGWITMVITAALVALVHPDPPSLPRGRREGRGSCRASSRSTTPPPAELAQPAELDPTKPTAVVLAGGFGGLGLHTLMQIPRVFPGQFEQVVFVAAGVIDAGVFKGKDEVDALAQEDRRRSRQVRRVRAHAHGLGRRPRLAIGTEAVTELDRLCREVALRFPRSVFFAGKLIFQRRELVPAAAPQRDRAAVERRLQFAGLTDDRDAGADVPRPERWLIELDRILIAAGGCLTGNMRRSGY